MIFIFNDICYWENFVFEFRLVICDLWLYYMGVIVLGIKKFKSKLGYFLRYEFDLLSYYSFKVLLIDRKWKKYVNFLYDEFVIWFYQF